MVLDKRVREQLQAHCGELADDDGVDPREFFKPPKPRSQHGRKTLQLCSQVAETLSMIFAGELDDDLLQGLRVESVVPAPNASQLAVNLRTVEPCDEATQQAIRQQLARITGALRCEVAAAITRRRAPKLVFHLGEHP